MELHRFKVIYSEEEGLYRIIDLTDTYIVGVTEMFESDDEFDRESRVNLYNGIRSKEVLGAKVIGYGIFILLDEKNSASWPKTKDDYVRAVLRQMAAFFKETEIDTNPSFFKDYQISNKTKANRVSLTPEKLSPSYPKTTQLLDSTVTTIKGKKGIPTWLRVGLIIVGVVGAIVLLSLLIDSFIYIFIFILCAIAFIPELFKKR